MNTKIIIIVFWISQVGLLLCSIHFRPDNTAALFVKFLSNGCSLSNIVKDLSREKEMTNSLEGRVTTLEEVISGQEVCNSETALQEWITEMRQEYIHHATNAVTSMATLMKQYLEEIEVLDSIRKYTRDHLVSLASDLNKKDYDISDCLTSALKKVANTLSEARKQVDECISTASINIYAATRKYAIIGIKIKSVFDEKTQSNQNCKYFGMENEVCTCIIITELNEKKDDFINRMDELKLMIQMEVDQDSENLKKIVDTSQLSINNFIQVTLQELIKCISKL